jgi:opacity protein-like surface antigen
MEYGLVGYKFADLDIRLDNFVNNFIQIGSVENPSRDGWVLGVGLEVMATDCIFVGLEYTAHLANSDRIDNSPIRVETTDHSGKVRAGLKFW